jgi:hypothetical protein
MSYVPPHLRNRKEKPNPAKETKIIEAEFPAFVSNRPLTTHFRGASFLSKITELPKSEPISTTKEITIPTTRSMYSRYDHKYDDEKDEDEEVEPEQKPPTKPENDEWQTVERKIRVKRDKVQEALDNDDAPLDDEQDESAWDEQPEEYETYWDERRR